MKTRAAFLADLHWALSSPALLQHVPTHLSGQLADRSLCQQLLHGIDRRLASLPEIKPRLGHYFESLINAAIARHPGFQLIARNLGVFEHKRQTGEFDLLFQYQQQCFHWEMAVKFYLWHPPSERWYGPNAHDHLDRKLEKLFNQQLQLSQSDPGRTLLAQQYGIETPLLCQALLKGWLFYPFQETPLCAAWINPAHLQGWWCYQHQLPSLIADRPLSRWAILHRLDWMLPANALSLTQTFDSRQIAAQIAQFPTPPLLAELQRDETGLWSEVSRGFIMPDYWPDTSG